MRPIPFLVEFAFSGLTVAAGLLVPESPVYLLQKNREQEALKAYTRLYGRFNAEQGLSNLKTRLEKDKEITGEAAGTGGESGYIACFRGSNWRRTRIIAWSNVIPQLLGMTLISNAPYFFVMVGMSPLWAVNLVEIGTAINVVGGLLGLFIIAKVGRRTLFLATTVAVGVLWTSVGVGGCFPQSESAMMFVGVMILIIAALLMSCVATVYAAIAAETSATHLRAYSQGIAFAVNGFFQWLFAFFVPYLFNADAANLGGKAGFFFAGLSIVSWLIGFLEIPEMRGRSFIELDEMFAAQVPTRQFAWHKTAELIQRDVNDKPTEVL
ncbi:general substrate transporter [Thozetella sp. PMI_491]|nr:general substrate transporter [Thozetella sp. PMI_491]